MSASAVDAPVEVRSEGTRVIVLLGGPIDPAFGQVLGAGLAAALHAGDPLIMDVRALADDVAALQGIGKVADVVAAAGHGVVVRGATGALRANLLLRGNVVVTEL